VLGFSMGGVLALQLCSLRSIRGALLLAAPLDLGWLRRTLARSFAPFLTAIPRVPGVVERAARERDLGYRRMPLRSVLELMQLQRLVAGSLPEVRVPLRLLYSRGDATVDPRDAERISRVARSANVELQYLERSGHMLTLDLEREHVAKWIVDQLRTWEAPHRRG
jgi:carboxylesterase